MELFTSEHRAYENFGHWILTNWKMLLKVPFGSKTKHCDNWNSVFHSYKYIISIFWLWCLLHCMRIIFYCICFLTDANSSLNCNRLKLWLFFAYVVSFVSLAASVGLLIQDSIVTTGPSVWTGTAGVLQCVFVLVRYVHLFFTHFSLLLFFSFAHYIGVSAFGPFSGSWMNAFVLYILWYMSE